MADEAASGIEGSQSRVRQNATKTREDKKGFARRVAKPLIIAFAILIPILLWWRSNGEETITKIVSPSPTSQGPQVVVQPPAMVVHPGRATEDGPTAAVLVGVTYREVTSTEEPLVLIGRSGFCLRWWGDGGPDSPTTFVVYVRGVNHKEWIEWHEFQRLKAEKRAPFKNLGFFKFKTTTGGPVLVNYEFRMAGQCT